MKNFIILQTVTPDYRKKIFSYIKEEIGVPFELYAGDFYFEKSVKSDKSIPFKKDINNYYFFGRRILIQTGMWKNTLKSNILVLELNPRIISNWAILLLRKITSKKTVLWGHAWPRGGAKKNSDFLRNAMRKLADEIIVYTNSQQKELQQKMPNKKIVAAPNSIFHKNEMVANMDSAQIKNLIYVGRLTHNKKVLFLIKAFQKALPKLPNDMNLIVVGDGEERESLKKYIDINKLNHRIKLTGRISDFKKLKKLYAESLASVSPGYIGLSVTQSFGFGVPMLVSKNEPHSPEIEAVIENKNALFFETNDINDLTEKILLLHSKKDKWIQKRKNIANYCKDNYSIESMAQPFIELYNN